MTPMIADTLRARGAELRQARAARTRTIRRRVAAGAVSLFLAAWLLIAVVLVSGHDPALAARKVTTASTLSGTTTISGAAQTATTATTATTPTGSTTSTTATGTSSASNSSGTSSSSNTNSGLTTRQS
jgi:type IV secretory pathway TrbL component